MAILTASSPGEEYQSARGISGAFHVERAVDVSGTDGTVGFHVKLGTFRATAIAV